MNSVKTNGKVTLKEIIKIISCLFLFVSVHVGASSLISNEMNRNIINVSPSDKILFVLDSWRNDIIQPSTKGKLDKDIYLNDGIDILEFNEGDQYVRVGDWYATSRIIEKQKIKLGAGNDTYLSLNDTQVKELYLDLGSGKNRAWLDGVINFELYNNVNKDLVVGSDSSERSTIDLRGTPEYGVLNIKNTDLYIGVGGDGRRGFLSGKEGEVIVNAFGDNKIKLSEWITNREYASKTVLNMIKGNNIIDIYKFSSYKNIINIASDSGETIIKPYTNDSGDYNDLKLSLDSNIYNEIKFYPGIKFHDAKFEYGMDGLVTIVNNKQVIKFDSRLVEDIFISKSTPLELVYKFDDASMDIRDILKGLGVITKPKLVIDNAVFDNPIISYNKESQTLSYDLSMDCISYESDCNVFNYSKNVVIDEVEINFPKNISVEKITINYEKDDYYNEFIAIKYLDEEFKIPYKYVDIIFTNSFSYKFSNSEYSGEEFYDMVFKEKVTQLTSNNDNYKNHFKNIEAVIYMLDGDDEFEGDGGIVYPGRGNDSIIGADKVIIEADSGSDVIKSNKSQLLEIVLPNTTSIHNINFELSKSYYGRSQNFNGVLKLGNNNEFKIIDLVQCSSICVMANVLVTVPGLGSIHIKDIEQLMEKILFFDLDNYLDSISNKIMEPTLLKVKTINFVQNYNYNLSFNGNELCSYEFDESYSYYFNNSSLECMFDISNIPDGEHVISATYTINSKRYNYQRKVTVEDTPKIIKVSKVPSHMAKYPFDIEFSHNQKNAKVDIVVNGKPYLENLPSGGFKFAKKFDAPFKEGMNDIEFVLKNKSRSDSVKYEIDYKDVDVKPKNISSYYHGDGFHYLNWTSEDYDCDSLCKGFKLVFSNKPITRDAIPELLETGNVCTDEDKNGQFDFYSEYSCIANLNDKKSFSKSEGFYAAISTVDNFDNIGKFTIYEKAIDIIHPVATFMLNASNKLNNTIGPGVIDVEVKYSEEVKNPHKLVLSTSWWSNIDLEVSYDKDKDVYKTRIETERIKSRYKKRHNETTASAEFDSYAVDVNGNESLEVERVNFDFWGPELRVLGVNSEQDNEFLLYKTGSDIKLTVAFDEPPKSEVEPKFKYLLSGNNRAETKINGVKKLKEGRYELSFNLPDDVGLKQQESLLLLYNAIDILGNESNKSIKVAKYVSVKDNIPPKSPRLLPSQSRGLDFIELKFQFDDIYKDISHFHLYVDNLPLVKVDKDKREFVIKGLSASNKYKVTLSAVDNNGNESDKDTEYYYTYPEHPTIKSSTLLENEILVKWEPKINDPHVDRYMVFYGAKPFSQINKRGWSYVAFDELSQQKIPLKYKRVNGRDTGKVVIDNIDENTDYYIAVVSVRWWKNFYTHVTSIEATPAGDVVPPTITDITWNQQPFSDTTEITQKGTWSVTATDDSEVSRMEVMLNEQLLGIDSSAEDGLTAAFDPQVHTDGNTKVTFRVFDIYDNVAEQAYNFTVKLAAPDAPRIVSPADQHVTGERSLSVSVNAPGSQSVQLLLNGTSQSKWLAVDDNQQVTSQLLLDAGDNTITAVSKNRGGESTQSQPVTVKYDTHIPATPTSLLGLAKAGGQVSLAWTAVLDNNRTGFNIYRAAEAFTDSQQATKLNAVPVSSNKYADLPETDAAYVYRIAAVAKNGIESPLSNAVEVTSDSLAPTAKLTYTPMGAYDDVSNTYGRGELLLDVQISEPLVTPPFISLSTQGQLQTVQLNALSELDYQGRVVMDESWPLGNALVTFSARDKVGNRGFKVTEGGTIAVDTHGPDVASVVSIPAAPVKADALAGDVEVTFTFNEEIHAQEYPVLEYQLGKRAAQSATLTKVKDKVWQTRISLPDDAGEAEPEWLSFVITAQDMLGNQANFRSDEKQMIEIYQNDLPPSAVPLGLKAVAMAEGKVKLAWLPVDGAAEYLLFRQAEGETELLPVTRVTSAEFIDQPDADGSYQYAVASVRRANEQEAISQPSDKVMVNADSAKPAIPENITAELTSRGVKLSWGHDLTERGISYQVYRADLSPIADISELEPIVTGLKQTSVIDAKPRQSLPAYAVVAVDEAGNRSDISETVYLNISLLPVTDIVIEKVEGAYPTLRWQHESATLKGVELTVGSGASAILLTDEPIQEKYYIDTGYTNRERNYSFVAVDKNAERSLVREVLLPEVEFSFVPETVIKRNLFTKAMVELVNHSGVVLENQQLELQIPGRTVQSEPFTLQPGLQAVAITIPGDESLPDMVQATLALVGSAYEGQTVRLAKAVALNVVEGQVDISLETRNVIRGGQGEFRYIITNPGDETLSVLTARNHSRDASPDVRISLLDVDDNTLSAKRYKQSVGKNFITASNGHTVLNVSPDERYVSEWISFNVPQATPADAELKLDIAHLYANYNRENEQKIAGLAVRKVLNLIDTPYFGTVDAVTPEISFGDKPVVIRGQSVERDTGQPMASSALKVVVANQGFEREFEVMTDQDGIFSYEYQPQSGETGTFEISVLHPELTERPNQACFIIQNALVTPKRAHLKLVKTVESVIPLRITTGQETSLTQVTLVPQAELPDGVEVMLPQPFDVAASSNKQIPVRVVASDEAEPEGEFMLEVRALVSGEAEPRTIGQLHTRYAAKEAQPNVFVSPTQIEMGATLTGSDESNLVIENRGTETLYALQVDLLTKQGYPVPAWIQNRSSNRFAQLKAGESLTLNLGIFPDSTSAIGLEEFMVKLTSANHTTRHIPLIVSLVESGVGGVQVKVANIYTGTLDESGQPIQGLQGAGVMLRHEADPDIEYKAVTDEYGEIYLPEIQAGSYQFWVRKSGHQTYSGRLRVTPGLTHNESVFLEYEVVKLDWNVKEIPLLDKYEIILDVDFVTNVPAAVLITEPAAIILPDLKPGEVFKGEITVTNQGLIRARDVQFNLPQSDKYFRFELLNDALPEVIEPKQSIRIPYKVTALSAFAPDGTSTGGGCQHYRRCMQVQSKFDCAAGAVSNANTSSCFVVPRTCRSGAKGGSAGTGGWGWFGGWGGYIQQDTTPKEAPPFSLPMCRVDCPERCESTNLGGGN